MARTFGGVSTDRVISGLTAASALRTYSIWARRTGAGGANEGHIFAKTAIDYLLYNGDLLVFQSDWSGDDGTWNWESPTINVWHHLAITYDSGNVANEPILYIDGVAQGFNWPSQPTGTIVTGTTAFVIGNRAAADRNWAGDLAEFTVWNAILPVAEIARLAVGIWPLQVHLANLAVYHSLCTAAASEPDLSGAGLTGAATGTALAVHPMALSGPRTLSCLGVSR